MLCLLSDVQYLTHLYSQDTNTTQFQLMTLFATRNGNISVVGDPDQSSLSFSKGFYPILTIFQYMAGVQRKLKTSPE